MIYQCYFQPAQATKLFSESPYTGFGLEPEVNPGIDHQCPELADATTRKALTEYAAFLHIWRHLPYDDDDWIGFTSYRQLDKVSFRFNTKTEIEAMLQKADFLAWGWFHVAPIRYGPYRGAAAQSEIAHPTLMPFTEDVLRASGETVPTEFQTAPAVPYANYWVLPKTLFARYMEWSWPIVRRALANDHSYKTFDRSWNIRDEKSKAVGYFVERLFIIWCMKSQLRGALLAYLREGLPRGHAR